MFNIFSVVIDLQFSLSFWVTNALCPKYPPQPTVYRLCFPFPTIFIDFSQTLHTIFMLVSPSKVVETDLLVKHNVI